MSLKYLIAHTSYSAKTAYSVGCIFPNLSLQYYIKEQDKS